MVKKCELCNVNEGTINVRLYPITKICSACSSELDKGFPKTEKVSAQEILYKLKQENIKIMEKAKNQFKKMSDEQLLLEHDEITSKPLDPCVFEYLDELNKEIRFRNLNVNDYDNFNDQITIQDFEKYIENNKVDDDYTFVDYKRDVLRAREDLIQLGNKIVEKYNGIKT